MVHEKIYHDAGSDSPQEITVDEICRLIRDAGWVPAQRDQYYNVLRRHDPADPSSPDLRPLESPPLRDVRKIDKQFIGAAPGLDDGADRSVTVQLPILGSR